MCFYSEALTLRSMAECQYLSLKIDHNPRWPTCNVVLYLSVEDQISKAELRLTDIADTLQGDWVMLARQLGITEDEITKIQTEYTYVSEQALVMLHLWVQKNQQEATGMYRHHPPCNLSICGSLCLLP